MPTAAIGFRPAFAGNRAATYVVVATLLLWAALEVRQSFNRHTGAVVSDRRSLLVLRVVSGIGAAIAAISILRVNATAFSFGPVVFATGLALVWSGLALRWWSFHALGRYFTFTVQTSPEQKVVTDGPYRWLRHPSYTGVLLFLAGIGVLYGNWIAVAALVVFPLVGMLYRIRIEEAALSRALGARYTDYARSRKRLVPYVW